MPLLSDRHRLPRRNHYQEGPGLLFVATQSRGLRARFRETRCDYRRAPSLVHQTRAGTARQPRVGPTRVPRTLQVLASDIAKASDHRCEVEALFVPAVGAGEAAPASRHVVPLRGAKHDDAGSALAVSSSYEPGNRCLFVDSTRSADHQLGCGEGLSRLSLRTMRGDFGQARRTLRLTEKLADLKLAVSLNQ